VVLTDGATISVAELSNRLVDAAVGALREQLGFGDHPFDVEVAVTDSPTVKLPAGDLQVTRARVRGVVRRTSRVVPLDGRYFLEDEEGRPFALATIAVVDGSLFGIMLNETRHVGAFLIPDALRSVRPIRHPVGPSIQCSFIAWTPPIQTVVEAWSTVGPGAECGECPG